VFAKEGKKLMAEKIKSRPILCSIISTFIISILWGSATFFIRAQGLYKQEGEQMLLLISSVVNILFSVLAVALLSLINQMSFKQIFSANGLAKGSIALLPVASFFLFGLILNMFSVEYTSFDSINMFPITAFMQATSAFMQNVLFRGLLVTALFIKFSGSKKERVKTVFKASALYLLIYIPVNILNTGGIELMQLINTFVIGSGFCAAYLYSKNIMSLILAQGSWQILNSAVDLFSAEAPSQFSPLAAIALILILILITAFSALFAGRAEPFPGSFETIDVYSKTTSKRS